MSRHISEMWSVHRNFEAARRSCSWDAAIEEECAHASSAQRRPLFEDYVPIPSKPHHGFARHARHSAFVADTIQFRPSPTRSRSTSPPPYSTSMQVRVPSIGPGT